jgi:hypothetical protein
LVESLRERGPKLLANYYRPDPDLHALIHESVEGNTFRAFQKLSPKPSDTFRIWAKARLSFSAMFDFGAVQTQEEYDALIAAHLRSLHSQWQKVYQVDLGFGSGKKIINLLMNRVLCSSEINAADRARIIPFLHVPHDEYTLVAIRLAAASGKYGTGIAVGKKPSMKFVENEEQYNALQTMFRALAAEAGVAPICIDLLAWDEGHPD